MLRKFAILFVCAVLVLIAIFVATGSAPERLPQPTRAVRVPELCAPAAKLPVNFDQWLPAFLTRANAPRLDCGLISDDEVYRVVWAHAFATLHPITVSVQRTGGMVTATTSEYRFVNGRVEQVSRSSRTVPITEWTRIRTQIANIEFWQMEPMEPAEVQDGSSWTIEGRVERRYHRVTRVSPHASPFRRLALELLRLGGRDDPEPQPRF